MYIVAEVFHSSLLIKTYQDGRSKWVGVDRDPVLVWLKSLFLFHIGKPTVIGSGGIGQNNPGKG